MIDNIGDQKQNIQAPDRIFVSEVSHPSIAMKPPKNEVDTAKKVMSTLKEVKEQVKKGRNDKAVQVTVKDAMSIAKEQMGKNKSDGKNGGHKNDVPPARVYVQSPHGYGQPQGHGSNQKY